MNWILILVVAGGGVSVSTSQSITEFYSKAACETAAASAKASIEDRRFVSSPLWGNVLVKGVCVEKGL